MTKAFFFVNITGMVLAQSLLPNIVLANENIPSNPENRQYIDKAVFNDYPLASGNSLGGNSGEFEAREKDGFPTQLSYDHSPKLIPYEQFQQLAETLVVQVGTPNPPQKVPSGFSDLNLSSPTSPAARLIGVSDGTIPRISTPSQFAVGVLNGLDGDGKFNTGINVDMLPYVLIRGNGLTLQDYRESWYQRFLSNTKLSIATARALDNVSTARAALGIEFVLINEGDPRLDPIYSKEIAAIQKRILATVNPRSTSEELRAAAQARDEELKTAKAEAERRSEQQRLWTIGLGQSWVTPTGNYSDLRGEGMGIWTTYRQPLGDQAQLQIHASTRTGERVSDRKGGFVNADTLVGGVRLLSGDSNFRFSLETAYNRESQGGQSINDYLSFGIGVEPRLYDNSWLSISFGGNTGRQNGTDFQFKTGIKWNINPGYVER